MRWIGHDKAEREIKRAAGEGKLHHAWILAGPRGLGKANFARNIAHWLLDHGQSDKTASLIAAGSHPDFKLLQRLPKESAKDVEDEELSDADLKRNISVDQVRELGALFSTRPSMAPRRVVLIDALDDLEKEGANALLKNLEEPPQGTIFLAVSHAPGRLLPTIRSRCQTVRFERLSEAEMAEAIGAVIPGLPEQELATLVRAGGGSPGKALSFAGLQMDELESAMHRIATEGDRDNRLRAELARSLSLKAAHSRYEAFLRRVPSFIADRGKAAGLTAAPVHLAAWEEATALSGKAMPLNIDKQAAVLEMGRILASLAYAGEDAHA